MCDSKGGRTTDYRNRVSLEWNKWRDVTAVICDKKVPMTRSHATSAYHDSTCERAERKTTSKIYGYDDMRANGMEEKGAQDWGKSCKAIQQAKNMAC